MQARSSTEWPRDIDRVRRHFEVWRGRRDRGRRIPQALWTAAVKLAHTHGVSRVSRAVGVDYYSLKKRLEAAGQPARSRNGVSASGTAKAPGPGDRPGFVELPMPVVPCVLEIEDRRGGRLRLELHGLGAEELAAVVGSVWSRRR